MESWPAWQKFRHQRWYQQLMSEDVILILCAPILQNYFQIVAKGITSFFSLYLGNLKYILEQCMNFKFNNTNVRVNSFCRKNRH